ncbi:MAG: DUF3791 domain-containing protein [Oscillospiraceae bacterium]|nr:DUF3791 domain-containing protein [Oscillospiraceae bacterium]
MALDQILYMQVEMANLYMERHNLSPDEFLERDEKYNILEFIKEGYEPFHLTGNEGILMEIQDYIETQK